MAKWTINDWNTKIDRTLTVRRLGRQGILYEYELPYGANPMNYYREAVNVKSIKRSENYSNGKRPGQYQPLGDKRYFNYYQLNQMRKDGREEKYIEWISEMLNRFYLQKFEEGIIKQVI